MYGFLQQLSHILLPIFVFWTMFNVGLVRETLDRSGVAVRIGADHIYRRSSEALVDFGAAARDGRAPKRR